ncbi:Fe-4S ferredoxin [Desulfonema magnum]|uniref:Fe-4S ferredoxin n=1 Tax=Desulfonema magnum TaxID=45655 RepID=A0A975BKZ8_9BACT|nr:Fe-4S ferredoxin [Desulfonema magnum]
MISPKLVEVGRHLNIELLTNTELLTLEGDPGHFTARITQQPRFIDLSKCTSCGECAKVCPINVPDEYNTGLCDRKAVYKQYAQAIPGAYAISKRGTAPCKATCPAHVSIQGYIALINQGKYEDALKLFKQEHPFPGVCGRVCHHPCEKECTRNDVDQPLGIQYLHRFLADQDMTGPGPYVPEIPEKREEKIAIVGSGPAGLSAAYFLAWKGYQVTVFEKLPVPGGMMAVGIPAYRLPRDILNAEIAIIEQMGVTIKTGVEFGKDITLEGLKADGFKSLFIAAGLHGSRGLGVEGEDLEGVLPGVSFLRDAALGNEVELGKRVVVVGGGNVAIDVSLTAKRLGAEQVTMVCLETRDEMPAWDYEIEEAVEEGIEIVTCFGPNRFAGEQGKIRGIEFKRCTCVFDDQCRFNPQYDEDDLQTMEADTIIVAIGQMLEPSVKDGLEGQRISIGPRGGLESDPVTFQTSLEWVFAGGDAVYGPRSVVEAVASGKDAAESIDRYLNGKDIAEGRIKNWVYEKPDTANKPHKERVPLTYLSVEEREHNFKEVAAGYKEEQARKEAERCLECGICSECYQCVQACMAGAVDHNQTQTDRDIPVGAVILCPGGDVFDPYVLDEFYHYKTNPNVLTSLEFERILSASGPTMGHLLRPSDEKEPKKIAWLQCVGSRDTNKCGNGYCSSVCCMYALKEAMVAKEHAHGDLECSIFNMDIRSFGKDYERYYERAKKDDIRFVKARVHTIDEVKESKDLCVRYADESGEIREEVFDTVVLSVGLQISESVADLAKRLNVAVDKYNFAVTEPFTPVETSRPGVYACGVFQSPKDIPTSVTDGSAAACAAGSRLAVSRGTCTKTVEIPKEIDLTGQEPRIGVFVCNCGINISGAVDVNGVEEYSKTLPHVAFAGQNLFTCSQDAQDQMKEQIKEHNLNRIVVASCTPKTHEAIFMDTLEACGLNKYLFEMANIRNQDSWIHSDSPEKATEKAKELVRMAVARAATLNPLHEKKIPITQSALIIGGGVAGMTSALGIADQGFDVFLVEKDPGLGGMANRLHKTIEGASVKPYLKDLIEKVTSHPKIQVLTQSLIVGFSGFKGNFTTEVLVGPGMYERKIDHGVLILATGGKEYSPKEFLYGRDDRVMTQLELADRLEEKGADDIDQVVMIQCVGSRNEANPNCSRICCQSAVKNALHIKKLRPEANVFILYRDMRMYGLLEDYYSEARRQGILFFRYTPDELPQVEVSEDDQLTVMFRDRILNRHIRVRTDILALSAGVVAEDTEELSSIVKLARNPEGFFMEAHVKLRPVDMATEGIYVCGSAHGPKLISESVSQSLAAASRATTLLSQEYLTLSAVTAVVNPDECASCLICVRSCPYGVPRINEDGVSEIDEALCHGCGVCASECPAKAIELNWYTDNQIMSKIEALLENELRIEN